MLRIHDRSRLSRNAIGRHLVVALRNNGFQNNTTGPPGLPHPTAGANLRVFN